MSHQREVAERIAQLRREKSVRERRDVLQSEIAQAIGVSAVSYGRYEAGLRKVPEEIIAALAEYHGTTAPFIRYGLEVEKPLATGLPVNHAAIEALRLARAAKREPQKKAAGGQRRPKRPRGPR